MKHLLSPIVVMLSTVPLLAFGYLIKYKKQINPISGYRPDEIS